jgi:hypothetical protein
MGSQIISREMGSAGSNAATKAVVVREMSHPGSQLISPEIRISRRPAIVLIDPPRENRRVRLHADDEHSFHPEAYAWSAG